MKPIILHTNINELKIGKHWLFTQIIKISRQFRNDVILNKKDGILL